MRRLALIVCLVAGVGVWSAPGAGAHVTETAGDLTISFGWRIEPTYAGLSNAVVVTAIDRDGVPVTDPDASLNTTISFGDQTAVRPLLPVDEPGVYSAEVVPTQPGTYSIQIAGSLGGETVDFSSTCSDTTFHCVAAASEVEFPPADSAGGGAAAGLSANSADDDDRTATIIGIAALALSAIALAVAVTIGIRSRRTERAD